MKKATWLLVCLAILSVGTITAFANDGNSPVRADIPFAFNVQNVSFAPGTYTLYQEHGFLRIRNEKDGSEKAFIAIPAEASTAKSDAELKFKDVDGTRYLTSVAGAGRQADILPGRAKKSAEQVLSAEGSR